MKGSGTSVAPRARSYVVVGACVLVLLTGQGCRESSKPAAGITITLIHQLWSDKGSQQRMNETLQTFTARSGIRVEASSGSGARSGATGDLAEPPGWKSKRAGCLRYRRDLARNPR